MTTLVEKVAHVFLQYAADITGFGQDGSIGSEEETFARAAIATVLREMVVLIEKIPIKKDYHPWTDDATGHWEDRGKPFDPEIQAFKRYQYPHEIAAMLRAFAAEHGIALDAQSPPPTQ